MSILDGSFAQEVADALADADIPLAGTIRHLTLTGSDDLGNPTYTTQDYSFSGWREDYSALFAAQSGMPTTDVRIVVVAKTCVVTPAQDDFLFLLGRWHRIRAIERIDPAGATIGCQSFLQDPS